MTLHKLDRGGFLGGAIPHRDNRLAVQQQISVAAADDLESCIVVEVQLEHACQGRGERPGRKDCGMRRAGWNMQRREPHLAGVEDRVLGVQKSEGETEFEVADGLTPQLAR